MARAESFTYNGEVVGGAAPTHATQIRGRFTFHCDQDVFEISVPIVVTGSYATLGQTCQDVEAALRQRYASFSISFDGVTQESFDPALATSTGWDQEPSLEKDPSFPSTGTARGYIFRVRVSAPPNFTDAYGPAVGRRQFDVSLHYDVNDRRVVTCSGVWTQYPSLAARSQFLAQVDAYMNTYRLPKIDATAKWAITSRQESDPQSLTTLTFTREYSETVNGRRGSTYKVSFQQNGLRVIEVRGTYLRTTAPYQTAATAVANYDADVLNHINTDLLANLTANEGGALVIGQTCETLTTEVTPNEQNDRADFAWVIRELATAQSTNVTGNFLDDPNIVADAITFRIFRNPLDDSPEPASVSQISGSGASAGGVSPNTGGGQTVTRTPAPTAGPTGTPSPFATQGANASTTPVVKPIDAWAVYEAWFKPAAGELQTYYESKVRPLLNRSFAAALGLSPIEQPGDEATFDRQNRKVQTVIHVRAYPGGLIGLQVKLGTVNDDGLSFDGAFTGSKDAYLVQQALTTKLMTRTIQATFLASATFDIKKYASRPWTPGQTGWVLYRTSLPDTVTTTRGIPGLGYGLISVTRVTLVEELRYVAQDVGGKNAGGGPANGAAQGGDNGGPANGANGNNNGPVGSNPKAGVGTSGNLFGGNAGFGRLGNGGSQSSAFTGTLGGP